jgi:hypothetical protein
MGGEPMSNITEAAVPVCEWRDAPDDPRFEQVLAAERFGYRLWVWKAKADPVRPWLAQYWHWCVARPLPCARACYGVMVTKQLAQITAEDVAARDFAETGRQGAPS